MCLMHDLHSPGARVGGAGPAFGLWTGSDTMYSLDLRSYALYISMIFC